MSDKVCKQQWVDSREYKIILNMQQFALPENGMERLWREVVPLAEGLGIKTRGKFRPEAPEQRQVRFLDTPALELRRNRYVFRLRGPVSARRIEGTLKYRNEDYFISRSLDLSARGYVCDCKFENDLIPSGMVYQTRSNTIELTRAEAEMPHFGRLRAIFPALAKLPIDKSTPLTVVNGFQADETAVKMVGAFELAGGEKANACFNFWRLPANPTQVRVAEFSFVFGMKQSGISGKTARQAAALLDGLKGLQGWYLMNAETKSDLVYDDKNPNAPPVG